MKKTNFKIKILGVVHDVKFVNKPVDDGEEECFGTYEQMERTITLSKKIDDQFQLVHTLFHEILHGIEQGLSIHCFESDEGHRDLDRLAYGITRYLEENNKEMFEKLFT